MATTEAVLQRVERQDSARSERDGGVRITAALSLLAVAIHGYHPYVEDGGVYLSGIKHLLNPSLYSSGTSFVTVHLSFSLFAPMVAEFMKTSRLDLMTVMFLLYVATVWLTLHAGWQIAIRSGATLRGRIGATSLLALMLTVPIAGTSLMLMDPYVTARSISTPFGLLALGYVMDVLDDARDQRDMNWRSVVLCAGSLAIACAMHPLMAAYSLGCVLMLACVSMRNEKVSMAATVGLCVLSVVIAGCLEWLWPRPSAEYARVAATRTYWFLSAWHWYEWIGLAAPLLVLAAVSFRKNADRSGTTRRLAVMSAMVGSSAILVALLFARETSASFLIARLQPLRVYQTIYLLMILALGAYLGEVVLKRATMRWAGLFVLVGCAMLLVQETTFPNSAHVEFPWVSPANQWEQGFLWIRDHTPQSATFAMDANYITADGENSQNFRAIAERSALPDYAKDGGVASIAPALTDEWLHGQATQDGLDEGLDAGRIASLRALRVDWVVLTANTKAVLPCPYANNAVKVCRLSGYGSDSVGRGVRPVALSSR